MKLREQSITFLVDAWEDQVDKRQEYLMQAFMVSTSHYYSSSYRLLGLVLMVYILLQYLLNHSQSQEVLQLSISFLDRFVRRFRENYDSQLMGAPLECLFEAILHIVEQLLDDGALEKSVANNNGDNIQVRR